MSAPRKIGGTWKTLLHHCRSYRVLPGFALICSVLSTVLTLLGPDKLSQITNLIQNGMQTVIDMRAISAIGFTLICFYLGSLFLSVFQGRIMVFVTQTLSKQLRTEISEKINRLPMSYYNRCATGDILSRVTNDVDTIAQSLNQSLGSLVTNVTQMLGAFVLMLRHNVLLALIAMLTALLGFALIRLITSKSQTHFVRQQENLGRINAHIEEIYAGHSVIRAYNGEQAALEGFQRRNEALQKAAFRSAAFGGLMPPLMHFIGNLGYVAVCVMGAILVFNGSMAIGSIVAFILYIRYFTQPLSQIAQAVQAMQAAAAAGERVFEFLEAEEMSDETGKEKRLETVRGKVEFDRVRFGYEDSERVLIRDFSAVAQPGQKIAIVGPTGAGKTTLINLLMRFHELKGGEIRIDGVPIHEMSRAELRAQFCMVLQDTWLFEGTLRENLVYNKEGVSDEVMQAACEAVGLQHFVQTLPKGYDTVLNEQVSLSQGEKQQLTIARAMIADKPMLILDEATSSVDTRTELKIQEAMEHLMQNRTSFVIAHRLSTIKNADLILVLKDGDIIESGDHESLLAMGGFYAELYNSQFEQSA